MTWQDWHTAVALLFLGLGCLVLVAVLESRFPDDTDDDED